MGEQAALMLPGYEILEILHHGDTSLVCRARRAADGLPVVLKRSLGESVSARQFTRYRNELELLRVLDLPGVVKAYDLVRHDGHIGLILEDFPGISLKRWIGTAPPLDARVEVAANLARIVRDVHSAGIVHKDLNPHNVLVDPATLRLKLIDFDVATRLRSEKASFRYPAALEGTLDYMAPEQTGRMNRPVDDRADLYSLGVTCYELLTGALPHDGSADPLETIHFHLAGRPVPPHERDARIPQVLSDIVMKLLKKAPEERYQSAAGVEADLERCLEGLRDPRKAAPFPLGEQDVLDRFDPPQRLYGRKAEKALLIDAFERIALGGAETLLVAGPPGIGKTVLVQELGGPITRRRGYFAAGKFDPLRRDVPLSALAAALQGLVQQLLTESDDSVARWKHAIERAVGRNGRLITDLIPAVELIIGPQPPLPDVDATERANRFHLAFQRFIQLFAKRAHPLVLFLDDVQWADPASLALISRVLSAPDTEALLVVQSYRDSEVPAGHPFRLSIDELERRGIPVTELELGPLPQEEIAQLVADALRREPDAALPLAETVALKTGGNPFFVRQFLEMLHADGLVTFDPALKGFRYDHGAITAASITENVAELLAGRLDRLSPETQRVLRLAAAIGFRFDLESLALIHGGPVAEAARHLEPAIAAGMIVPRSELESLTPDDLDSPLVYRRYSFLHDRVRQVAYSAIPEASRPALHLALGRALLAATPASELDAHVFDIVNHMNLGAALLDDDERPALVELNLRAGRKAKLSTAYSMAARCFRQAAELLGEGAWRGAYSLCFEAHVALAESLWLASSYDEALYVIRQAGERAACDLDRVRLCTLETAVHLSAGLMREALECGRRGARLARLEIPEGSEEIERMLESEIESILRRTSEIGIEKLLDLPSLEDPETAALMALLTHCLPAAFQSDQALFALMCCKMVSLSLEHGNSALSARAYGSFAALLSSRLRRYREAYRFARLGVDLCERLGDRTALSAASFLLAMFASHWNRPVAESIEQFKLAVQIGLETGDHQHAGYSAARRISHLQFRGLPLDELRKEAEEARDLLERIGDRANLDFLAPRLALIDWLSGDRPHGSTLGVGELDEERAGAEIAARGNLSFESDWMTLLLMQRYFAGDFRGAVRIARDGERLLPYSAAFVTRPEYEFYHALSLAALASGAEPSERSALEDRLDEAEALLARWAEHCDENYGHLHVLVLAERAALRGDVLEAMELYDRGINEAGERGFVNFEAIGAELAARFWLGRGKRDFGRLYLQRALHAYEIWGAAGKAADLRAEHGEAPAGGAAYRTSASATAATTTDRGDALDLASVIKASQAISREIRLDRLLVTLLDIIVENAGAETGALVLDSEGELLVRARKAASGPSVVQEGVGLGDAEDISPGIVYYVVRTEELVVLDEPAEHPHFRNDRYVRGKRPKSVLCAPIAHKGGVSGVLYLENNHVTGAFTPARLEALNILLAQIAVSIENAQLYERQTEQKRAIEQANVELKKEIGERERAEREIRRYRDHLEELVRERTAELANAQSRLVELSRRAGMAEVASGVLHNVGNVMNSVNVGASVTRDAVRKLPVERLAAVCDLLDANAASIGRFIERDPTGSRIPRYLRALADALLDDKAAVLENAERMLEHLEHMKKIIDAQQSYAKATGVTEVCTLVEIVETAIAIAEAGLESCSIEIVREFRELRPMTVDRHQILQIVVNLISNAKHALESGRETDRRLTIRIDADDGTARIEVEDNGVGIAPDHLQKIFNHGFTTKKDGHGFGLHNCANAARQMGGSLTAASDGEHRGAKFVLSIPIVYPQRAALSGGTAASAV